MTATSIGVTGTPATDASFTLFTEYIGICNRAIALHRTSFPFRQLFSGVDRTGGDVTFGVAVYDHDPQTPSDYFTVELRDDQLLVVAHGEADPEINWRVDEDHLREVVHHSDEYIQNPLRLDWDWLTARIRV